MTEQQAQAVIRCEAYHRRRPWPRAKFRVIYRRDPTDPPLLFCGVHVRSFRNAAGDAWQVEPL